MPASRRSGHPPQPRSLWPAATIAAAVALVAISLYVFPPSDTTLYPQCPIYALLGLRCPGCGATRALAALLSGHLAEALRLNALTTCALPIAAAYAIYRSFRPAAPSPIPASPLHRTAIYAGLAIAATFTVLRNCWT